MPRSLALLAVPALAILLAGCVPTPVPTPDPSSSTRPPTSTATASPTPTATAAPPAGPDTEPVTLGCGDAISAQAIYDFNPNVSLLTDFSPDEGSAAAEAVAQQGIACRLINQTSGAPLDIGIVHYTAAAYAAKASALSTSATPASSFDGYFDVVDGRGFAQAVSEPYLITVTSAEYTDAGDLAPLVEAVRDSVG